ncbi:5-(carboxyamino)imidazole ribonucleotide synthase [Corynebacterium sp. ES2794-CONJ1]|uniref:5-(carboxyamino)imidazole ribonucleotide synthase n=1 Tax=unclassified Corynebacterium TaxID=2624378 RepID=UPI002169C3A6|nr:MULTISPECIES: 5-(carboxyamino)imidazole ribonucleotide synthase [unclassified Corynebacterium]MCS4489505.1 5-(carboxyamino)imidazole ribonucleotide synthase [Corynebacterium sp. ES2775-CONJ]MCS4531416.1 5-(carboxyamino)imidazole ribonucleotide synthase [Corynebacterium sp. ES2730-CONJ]MCU9518803.1 5-(carboxyamino)imidazole ribonucleotide synthase [Corynebacterium sp. ES2794-CONJ1]
MSYQTPADSSRAAHASGMPIILVIGDGQLARMMHTEAIELGLSARILAATDQASAAQVSRDLHIGDYLSYTDLQNSATGTDVITFDHEHVPNDYIHSLLDEGYDVQPRPHALIYAQDKLLMRQRLSDMGAPIPPFAAISSRDDARAFYTRVNGAVCLKARRGGYDGHGVWFPRTVTELEELVDKLRAEGVELMAEEKIALSRELSVLVARTPSGEVKAWPVSQSVQENGICTETLTPAPGLSEKHSSEIKSLAQYIATELRVTGVLAVELFATDNGSVEPTILVNELAMRPHNTGHWTQNGCVTNQFEQHLRAVLDYPLGDTELTAPVIGMANVLGAPADPDLPMTARMKAVWRRYPTAKIHLYGKDYRPGRKLGHVNIAGDSADDVLQAARNAAHFLSTASWMD